MPENLEVELGGHPLSSIIRRVRREADMSQRQLAAHAGVSAATIGELETGSVTPSVPVLTRILSAAGFRLVPVDEAGRLVLPLLVWDKVADLAGRRFPAHLDTILDPAFGEWWADGFGLTRPPETFRRNRAYRDYLRRKSQWDVRVKQLRNAPEPRPPAAAG